MLEHANLEVRVHNIVEDELEERRSRRLTSAEIMLWPDIQSSCELRRAGIDSGFVADDGQRTDSQLFNDRLGVLLHQKALTTCTDSSSYTSALVQLAEAEIALSYQQALAAHQAQAIQAEQAREALLTGVTINRVMALGAV
jgi:hypothetical protein